MRFAVLGPLEVESDAGEAPGCLLLDLRIPDGSGLDLLARLEQSRTPLSVVVVTVLIARSTFCSSVLRVKSPAVVEAA